MNLELAPRYEEGTQDYIVENYDPARMPWEQFGPIIMEIATEGFPPLKDYERHIRKHFTDTQNTAVLLQHKPLKAYIGFAYAEPVERVYDGLGDYRNRVIYPHTAYISATVIRPLYQRKGLIRPMMETLEDRLRQRRYTHIERDSIDENGFSETIKKWYKQRIEKFSRHSSPYGPQTFFRIAL